MDDYLHSVESPERALIRSKEMVHLLHLGGFKFTKFVIIEPGVERHLSRQWTKLG